MSSYFDCDACGNTEYTVENPFVEVRTPRPSDRSDLCCIIAGCASCFCYEFVGRDWSTPPSVLQPGEWSDYIESIEAAKAGYMFLT